VEAAREEAPEFLAVGEIEARPSDGLVLAGGRVLTLSLRELELLTALMRRHGTIVSREELYSMVWDAPLRRGDRSVDVYVHKLRVKLESALPGWRYIHTHFGFGYRLSPEPSHPFHISATGP
jgi:DNA-binding response OmpR family regulator